MGFEQPQFNNTQESEEVLTQEAERSSGEMAAEILKEAVERYDSSQKKEPEPIAPRAQAEILTNPDSEKFPLESASEIENQQSPSELPEPHRMSEGNSETMEQGNGDGSRHFVERFEQYKTCEACGGKGRRWLILPCGACKGWGRVVASSERREGYY